MNAVTDTSRLLEQTSFRIHPVILAGGSGTRLWPLSRASYPKQLLPLTSDRTLLQETVLRNLSDAGYAEPIIVCNEEHRFMIEEQLQQVGVSAQQIILEPVGRNTGPALTAAAMLLNRREPGAMMLVQPADHAIGAVEALHMAVQAGLSPADTGRLVTFGIAPTRPETGYGYIKIGPVLDGADHVRHVDRFVEKPDAETAARYLDSGAFLWNSGIFLMSASHYLDQVGQLHPAMLESCEQAVDRGEEDLGFFRLDRGAFANAPALSIDRAVMEHTAQAAVIPVDMAWNDLGSWQALYEVGNADAEGNVISGDVIARDVSNSYLRADGKLLAVIGLDNVIVVNTDDAVLVAAADRVGEVGQIVEDLKRRNRQESLGHRKTNRPWGSYMSVDTGERFQVKRLTVKPGEKLSLQKHFHRSEHWVVVHGTAMVERDGESMLVRENESVYIPIGATHRLGNPGKLPLHLIEVQSGSYLGEDDIVRLADTYGRL